MTDPGGARVTLQPLGVDMRSVYASSWQRTQERFKGEPAQALVDADRLVTLLLDERGYPTKDGRLVPVQADPAGVVGDYREAHAAASREDLTAIEMRRAMDVYRRLVTTLLDEGRPSARGRR